VNATLSDIIWKTISGLLAVALTWLLVRRRNQNNSATLDCWLIAAEDALKVIGKLERERENVDMSVLAPTLGISEALTDNVITVLLESGWLQDDTSKGLRLTEQGRKRAQQLVRAHRLWEQYLVEHGEMTPEAVHAEAHRREHTTTPADAAKLDDELGHPARDPHGHPIPAAGSPVPEPGGVLLSECVVGKRMRVLDVADEPPVLFAQLVAMGLTPGAAVEVVRREKALLWVNVSENLLPLAATAAAYVRLAPLPALPVPMGELPAGSVARVVETQGTGKHQRRMLDMGLVPGAQVIVLRAAPLGDPVEYRVEHSAVSMRRSDANTILVEEEVPQEHD
jgi:Mn-dependent DtxR family transcriptional regulator/Fe2+ transport system protein FeoA